MKKYTDKIIRLIKQFYKFICTISSFRSDNLLDYKQTIDYALAHDKSIIRWGDGETIITLGLDIHYQNANIDLIEELNSLIELYSESQTNFVFCLPNSYLKLNGYQLIKNGSWRYWIATRYLFKTKFKKELIYGDAFLFGNDRFEEYSKLWMGVKNLIFVHSNDESFEYFCLLHPNKNHYYVKIPNKNSYSQINDIEKQILSIVKNNKFNKSNCRILISAGPCGKVLVFKISNLGLIAYDTGHCWCEPLKIYDWEK